MVPGALVQIAQDILEALGVHIVEEDRSVHVSSQYKKINQK